MINGDINDKMSAWYMHVILMQRQRKMWCLHAGQACLLDAFAWYVAATICDIGLGGVWRVPKKKGDWKEKQKESDCVNGLKFPQHLHIYTHTQTHTAFSWTSSGGGFTPASIKQSIWIADLSPLRDNYPHYSIDEVAPKKSL